MRFKKRSEGGHQSADTSRRPLLTPEELHDRAEELWAALYANDSRAQHEGVQRVPNADLLYRLMNLVERILDNNKRGRKGFDGGDPQWSRISECEVFKSVRHALERELGWQLMMPLTEEEQRREEYKQAMCDEIIGMSRRRYGRFVPEAKSTPVEEPGANDITAEDEEWLRRFGLRPE
jgi:hypothetical protein